MGWIMAVGNGGYKAANRWKKLVNFPGEVFTCPDLSVYKALKMKYGSAEVSCCEYGRRFCEGFSKALCQIVCRCACVLSDKGDVEQQGGCVVISPSGRQVYVHRAQDFNDNP